MLLPLLAAAAAVSGGAQALPLAAAARLLQPAAASSYTSCFSCAGASLHWCGGATQQCVTSPAYCADPYCSASYASECATAGNASCAASNPTPFTTCAACAKSPFYWCGGLAQLCSVSPYKCPSYRCSASSPPQCPTSGARSCDGGAPATAASGAATQTSYSEYWAPWAGDEGPARTSVAAGVAASVASALLLLPLLLCRPCGRTAAAAPHLEPWAQPAQRAHRVLSAAFFLLSLGMLTASAAPAIPWLYIGGIAYTGLTVTIWGIDFAFYSLGSYPLLWGSVCVYSGLLPLVPAWVQTLLVAIRLRAFSQSRALPPTAACAANLVAIEGLAWTGFLIVLGGAAANWYIFSTSIAPAGLLPPGTETPGASLLYFAVFCLLLANLLLSFAARLLHGMPGLGRSRTHCLCPEPGAQARGAGVPVSPRVNSPKVAPHV